MSDTVAGEAWRLPLLDVGGEGRYRWAWNLNPNRYKTIGPNRGQPIPRLIVGRADAIPLRDACVTVVLVERTPLSRAAAGEIRRVVAPGGLVILRHVPYPDRDRHAMAVREIQGTVRRAQRRIGRTIVQETLIRIHHLPPTNQPPEARETTCVAEALREILSQDDES